MEGKKKNLIWAALCPIIYIVTLWNLIPFVYGIVDDRTMMEVVSGQYLGIPDAHTIFIGYWYSLFVTELYKLFSAVEWYALCFLALQWGCMSLVFYRLLNRQKNRSQKIYMSVLALLWCAALGVQITAQITFTTTAAVLAITAIFWYMTTEEFRSVQLLVLFLLCFLAAEIRISVFYMIIPVCAVLWLFRTWEEGVKKKGHLVVPLLAAGAMLLYFLGETMGYGSTQWKAYLHHRDNDTMIYDYGDYEFPRYEDAQDLYNSLGIESKVRVKNLYYYNFTADDRISPAFFDEYVEARGTMSEEPVISFQRLKESIKHYIKGTVSGEYGYRHLLALCGYGILIVWYGIHREWKQCLKACCVAGVQILLWLYLVYRGRLPERVLVCMNLMLIVPLLVMWLEVFHCRKSSIRYRRVGGGFLVAALCMSTVWYVATVRQKNVEFSKQNQSVETLKEYCEEHQENFYFNDVTSLAFSTWNVRLWYERPYGMNYMPLGDWICYSPIWEHKLQQQGIVDVKDALYMQDHVYLISSFDRGVEYLTDLYDNVICTEVDKVHEFNIYKLEF